MKIQEGLYLVVKDASEDQIDELASHASKVSGAKTFILKPEVLEEYVALTAELNGSKVPWAFRRSRNNGLRLLGGLNAGLAVDTESIRQACAVILIGVPRAPTLLYPFVVGVAEGGNVFSVTRMAELAYFVGDCSDPLQRVAGCSACSTPSCYSKEQLACASSSVWDWLENDVKGYLTPAKLHDVFSKRRMLHSEVYPAISWSGEEMVRGLRALYAAKASASKSKIKKDCSRCIEASGRREWARSCELFKVCKAPFTSDDIKKFLINFSKEKGLSTNPRSYTAQANMALSGFNVRLKIKGNRVRYWTVGYVYRGQPPYGHMLLNAVKPCTGTQPLLGKIPGDIYVYLYKRSSSSYMSQGEGVTIKLKDLLGGIENLSERAKRVYDRERWVKCYQETLLLCNLLNAHPYGGAALSASNTKNSYYTEHLSLPTSAATVDSKGNLRPVHFKPTNKYSCSSYNAWLGREESWNSRGNRRILEFIKDSKVGRVSSLLSELGGY